MSFIRVASLSELPAGSLLAVVTPSGERICLVNRDGEVSAIGDVCPHQAFPISAGQLLDDGTVECVWHGARFDCRSGALRQGPATDDLPAYEVRVEGDDVYVNAGRSGNGGAPGGAGW
jgi:3-phenylpropionate/trans-cinnamate dioxygenase ferredoxin subunit